VTAHWSHTGGIDPDTTTGSEIYFASDHFGKCPLRWFEGKKADLTGPVMEYMAACKHGESTANMSATRSDDIVR
jgi:hypothetical protein